jgi:WD40 repeat protein
MLFFSSVEAHIGVWIGRRTNSAVQWYKPFDSHWPMEQGAHFTGRVNGCRRVHRLECMATVNYCTVILNETNLLQVCGCKLAAGLKDGAVVVWHEDGTKSFELKQHSKQISSINWNGAEEKSHLFVTGSWDQVNNLQIE